MKAPSAGNYTNCRLLVALRSDGSCPSCGLSDALRPLPTTLSVTRPNLKASVVYTATRVVTFFVAPVLACFFAYSMWGTYEYVPSSAYLLAAGAGLLLGLLLGPALGALLAYLPWLVAQGINRAVIAPYQASRWAGRAEPTFQGAFQKLARRRTELSDELNRMHRTLARVRAARDARDGTAASSRERLAAAEQALRSGIAARRAALESVDTVWYEVEYQLLECEIAAVRLLPCETAEAARAWLARLRQIEPRLRAVTERARSLQDAARRARALRASQSAEERYRAACRHFQAVEEGSLLAEAASLLKEVRPVQDHHHRLPGAASLDTFDHGATLLRISDAVAECVEERLRVEAEIETVAEVEAICEPAVIPGRRSQGG